MVFVVRPHEFKLVMSSCSRLEWDNVRYNQSVGNIWGTLICKAWALVFLWISIFSPGSLVSAATSVLCYFLLILLPSFIYHLLVFESYVVFLLKLLLPIIKLHQVRLHIRVFIEFHIALLFQWKNTLNVFYVIRDCFFILLQSHCWAVVFLAMNGGSFGRTVAEDRARGRFCWFAERTEERFQGARNGLCWKNSRISGWGSGWQGYETGMVFSFSYWCKRLNLGRSQMQLLFFLTYMAYLGDWHRWWYCTLETLSWLHHNLGL